MTPEMHAATAEAEEKHWWYSGRRDILRAVVDRHLPAGTDRTILEVGCGSGGNLSWLMRYGKVFAVEVAADARARASARGVGTVEAGSLPDALPFAQERFDLVLALDVLEHVEEDARALTALRAKLNDGGLLLLTVPAFGWLWSRRDALNQHYRRYTKAELASKVSATGFRTTYASYFNTLLFPLVVAHFKILSPLGSEADPGLQIPPAPLNALLRGVFSLERHVVPRTTLPFGVSIVLCAIAD